MERIFKNMDKVHRWEVFGEKFVLDCNSCRWYACDDITYDVLRLAETGMNHAQIFSGLGSKYDKNDIRLSLERLEQLALAGRLFSDDTMPDNGKPKTAIGGAAVNVAHACNLRCSYCFGCWPENAENYVGSGGIMSEETARQSADWIFNISKNTNNFRISFFGGEPLLAVPAIKVFIDQIRELCRTNKRKDDFVFCITTNATALTEKVQVFLRDEGVRFMIASIDGHQEMHDAHRVYANGESSYADTMTNLESYQQRGGRFTARATYVKDTVGKFCEGIFVLADKGFSSISMEPAIMPYDSPLALRSDEVKIAKNQYDMFIREYLRRIIDDGGFDFFHFRHALNFYHKGQPKIRECGAGCGYVTISYEGDVYPCHKFVGNLSYKMGNIFQGITKPDVGYRLWDNYVNAKEQCRMCWARYVCGGACHADNNLVNNDIAIPVAEKCELVKYRYELGAWLYSELEEKKPEYLKKLFGSDRVLKTTKPKKCNEIESIRLTNESHILSNTVRGNKLKITSSAALIWHCCDGDHTVTEIADIVAEVCSVGKFGLLEDIKKTVQYFRKEGLLQW